MFKTIIYDPHGNQMEEVIHDDVRIFESGIICFYRGDFAFQTVKEFGSMIHMKLEDKVDNV